MITFFTAWTCLKTHQTWNISHNFIIYCCPEFPPLGGAIIKESVFWLITPIYFVTHSKIFFFFFCKFMTHCKPPFSNSSQAISPICVDPRNKILVKTGSVAYLHSGVSEWHETQVTTFPLAPKALCNSLGDDHQVVHFKLKHFISRHPRVGLRQNMVQMLPMPSQR